MPFLIEAAVIRQPALEIPLVRETNQRPAVAVLLSGREQFSPYFGGALARWTFEVYRCLGDQLDVEVFGFPTAEADRYPLPHGSSELWRACQVIGRIPFLRRYEEHLWLGALLGRLRKFNVIHIHNRPQWVALLRQLGYSGGIVLHLQNNHLGHWTGPELDELARQVDCVAVCSTFLRDTFAEKSTAIALKSRVVFNGVDTHLFHPREDLRVDKTVFFVGRFDAEKGVLQLVQAFSHVLQSHPDARLVIGGTTGFGTHTETPYVREVRQEAARLESGHPGCVCFLGYLHHDNDLPGHFQRAAIFACPSLFQEPFGLVNAEAMACATPVVGARRGGIPEVVGNSGILIDPEDSIGFGKALAELLDRPERREQMGIIGVRRARNMFDWAIIAKAWLALLEEVEFLSRR